MNKTKWSLHLLLAFGLCASTPAFANNDSSGKELLQDMQALALKCVVHTFKRDEKGQKNYVDYVNRCQEIQVVGANKATIFVEDETYSLELRASEDSDGGDLDHLLVYDSNGQLVAQRTNVLAFDNILLAISGGKTGFLELEVNN